MYNVIQFDQAGGGSLAIVHEKWLTPRKKEVFWPPYKDNKNIKQALMKGEEVNRETYLIYGVHRIFFQTDDIQTAERKLVLAEYTSDLNTTESEGDAEKLKKSRNKRCQKVLTDFITKSPTSKKSKRINSISSSESDTDNDNNPESNVMTEEHSLTTPPFSLHVQQKDAVSNFIKSVDTPQKSTQGREKLEFLQEIWSHQEKINNTDKNNIDYKTLLLQIYGVQTKTLQTVHTLSLKFENMQKQILQVQQKKTSDIESIRLSNEQLKLIREYFPIDKKQENPNKKIDVVEKKLSLEKKFLKTVVSFFYAYLLFYHFSTISLSIRQIKSSLHSVF